MENIQVRHDDSVAVVTLADADRMNSLDPDLLRRLRTTFQDLLGDPSVRAMVLTGSGRSFSAGADVGAFETALEQGTAGQFMLDATAQLHPLLLALYRSDKPLVAAVNGVAAGGGLGLALAADSRIGTEASRFAAGYFGLGASPDGGSTWLMPRLIGVQRTRRFLFDNEVMGVDEALRCGLLDDLVAPDMLLDRAVERARHWGAWAAHSRGSTKRLLDAQQTNDLATQLEMERRLIAASATTADFTEGVAAFREKRRPVFR